MKNTQQMFGKLQRQLDAEAREIREAAAAEKRREAEAEARLDAPLTRREVLDAIRTVSWEYAQQGDHDSNLISNAFTKLVEALS